MKKTVTICENCQTRLQGDYCHACGQRAIEVRRPVIGLAQDIIVDTLALDSKLWRTVIGLLVNPGKLARNYIAGQRARHSPPFRAYLFFSLLFFASLFWAIGKDESRQKSTSGDDVSVTMTEPAQSVPAEPEIAPDPSESQNNRNMVEVNIGEGTWEDVDYNGPAYFEPFAKKIFENVKLAEDDPRLFFANVKDNIPRVLLLLPLFYTLLLLLFYFYKKGIFIYDLLIVSLYLHAAMYFYFTISLWVQLSPLDTIPVVNWLPNFIALWGVVQTFRVLATNFSNKWYSVALKGVIVNVGYLICAGLLIATGMALSLVY